MQQKSTGELERELSCCASLDQYLTENDGCVIRERALSEALEQIMQKKELRRADIIKNSGLNDIYVHQILAGKRHPSRNKLLCLLFGMGLDCDNAQQILKQCGYPPLYAKNLRDSIILHALQNGRSLLEVNETLFEHGEPMLA